MPKASRKKTPKRTPRPSAKRRVPTTRFKSADPQPKTRETPGR